MIYKFSFIEKILLSNDIITHPFADSSSSVGLAFALGSAVKLKIVDHLSTEFKDITQIAKEADVSEIGTELVLDCLDALGYVQKKDGQYAFTKRGFKNLSKQSPNNFRYFILFCDYLYKGYMQLDETIRMGRRPNSNMLEDLSEYEWKLFSRAMIDIAKTNMKEIAGKIPLKENHKKLLDLGGSHGLYSIELCKRHPQLKATIIDLYPVKKYAEECIAQYNALNSVSFLAADFMNDKLPKNVDVILAFNVIHGLNTNENEMLAEKVYDSLNDGGIYVILDQIKGIGNNSQMSRATTSYMALNLLHQAGGKTYSKNEIDTFTQKVGFKTSELKKLKAPGFGVVICYK